MLHGVKLLIRLKKASSHFYLMKKTADFKTILKFLDAYLLVSRVHPNHAIFFAQTMLLNKWVLAQYNITLVDLKTFTFSVGSKSLCIDKVELGPITKRLLFTMFINAVFNVPLTPTRRCLGTRIPTNFRFFNGNFCLAMAYTYK